MVSQPLVLCVFLMVRHVPVVRFYEYVDVALYGVPVYQPLRLADVDVAVSVGCLVVPLPHLRQFELPEQGEGELYRLRGEE